MQRIFSFFAIFCLSLSMIMVSFDADARRFGGGRSFGKAPSHFSRQSTPNKSPTNNPAGKKPGFGKGFMGPLAGFMAGGLLASLLMGGGFGGINFFDIIIIGLLAFFVIRFIRSRAQPASATNNANHISQRQADEVITPTFDSQQEEAVANAKPVINAPSWFNAETFIEAGKQHFIALQEHWDADDMNAIAEYVTPELLVFLKQERELDTGFQSTYVENLQVELDGVDDTAEKTVATLTFSGLVKTSRFDGGQPFNESWRMEREQGENKPWLVAGIRQNMQ